MRVPVTVYLGLGSNLGDRFANIELALRILETPGVHYSRFAEDAFVHVVDTSFMYETEPMYVSDQPKFINCACLVCLAFVMIFVLATDCALGRD